MCIVYKITNVINNKAYVGQSQQTLEERWSKHKSDAYRIGFNTHFYKAIRKYGIECWKQEILEEIEDISNLNEAEMKWIEYYDTFNNGYNCTNGGENGFIVTEETKEKIRQARLGKNHTEESKEKMREKRKLQIFSEATKEKIRQAKLGKKRGPMSEEQKEKISQGNTGKKLTEESKEKMRQAKLNMSEETKEKIRQAQLGKKRGPYKKKK